MMQMIQNLKAFSLGYEKEACVKMHRILSYSLYLCINDRDKFLLKGVQLQS